MFDGVRMNVPDPLPHSVRQGPLHCAVRSFFSGADFIRISNRKVANGPQFLDS